MVGDTKGVTWAQLATVPKKYQKDFRRRGFGGTAVDPMWRLLQFAQVVGDAGTGWHMTEPTYEILYEDDPAKAVVFCTVGVSIAETANNGRCVIYGSGGNALFRPTKIRDNPVEYRYDVDDEAFKSALTDALMNAFTKFGSSADVYLGEHHASKYVGATEPSPVAEVVSIPKPTVAPPAYVYSDTSGKSGPLSGHEWVEAFLKDAPEGTTQWLMNNRAELDRVYQKMPMGRKKVALEEAMRAHGVQV